MKLSPGIHTMVADGDAYPWIVEAFPFPPIEIGLIQEFKVVDTDVTVTHAMLFKSKQDLIGSILGPI